MCHHYFGFFLMKAVFAFISVHTGLFGNFDMNSFLESAEYFYYPRGLIQFAFVYVVAGITFSLVVHEVWVWLKERLLVFCGCST